LGSFTGEEEKKAKPSMAIAISAETPENSVTDDREISAVKNMRSENIANTENTQSDAHSQNNTRKMKKKYRENHKPWRSGY
jgi:hypothetical protein